MRITAIATPYPAAAAGLAIVAVERLSIISNIAVWTLCAATIACVLMRPRGIAEWVWAATGATLLAVSGLVPLRQVLAAVGRGTDVYLFLAGMMVLAELARREGLFDWVASHAVLAARGSRMRLFALVYAAGIVVTTILSNDATAVVLTPAVAAAVRKTRAEPLPYLLACAFIANAASFVLPISNPANLVVFAGAVPALPRWLGAFALPSLLSILATFGVLALVSRHALSGKLAGVLEAPELEGGGRTVLAGIGFTAIALLAASSVAAPLGATTFGCGALILAIASLRDRAALRQTVRGVSWTVLLLVAGLFVLVAGLDQTGLVALTRQGVETLARSSPVASVLAAAAITAAASNLINNLPAGLIAGAGVANLHGHTALRSAIAIGIDLGPNLSVTGSLATVLWLIALRREQIDVSAWTFLRAGALVMPPALVLAVVSALVTNR